jgi:hypothetical protein
MISCDEEAKGCPNAIYYRQWWADDWMRMIKIGRKDRVDSKISLEVMRETQQEFSKSVEKLRNSLGEEFCKKIRDYILTSVFTPCILHDKKGGMP